MLYETVMDFRTEFLSRLARIIAILALLLGLGDAARLLGVFQGATSPVDTLGPTGFTLLAIFSLARLCASVGLWIRASWGAILLLGTTVAELVLFLTGSPDIDIGVVGFATRLVLLSGVGALLLVAFRAWRRSVHD